MVESLHDAVRERRSILVRGIVQGVGFRPFVVRLARQRGLGGWVRNTSAGVEVEVEGVAHELDAFARELRIAAPPLASVEALEVHPRLPRGELSFAVLPSRTLAGELQPVPPDTATCAECLDELLDPTARRHRYPFTNCTGCGPRFTVIEALPYDRARTTLRGFALCAECRAEYTDPADRRFHAEPIACPRCGPRLEFHGEGVGGEAIEQAVSALRQGRIVALKGLGGFQLACDAADEVAVARLRARKARDAKPFALMVPDVESARDLCHVGETEAEALSGPRAPIVLLQRRTPAARAIAQGVAPGLDTLGVMLPYTPLHHLLLRAFAGPLVMTSGNRSEEPIAVDNEEARLRLADIADAFLLHDRGIAARYDDSVVRVDEPHPVVLRRARGYAPEPMRLPRSAPAPVLAVGAQLKATFCLVRGDQAFLGQHIGDLDDALTLAHYHRTLEQYRRLFALEPSVVAHDLHPDYATTRFALGMEGVRTLGVQHHHAHVVSCLAEHGVTGPAIGVAFDGTGYGTDGQAWGGELLVADWLHFRRRAHLAYLPLPGGDAAAREPWRMALAALHVAYGEEAAALADRLLHRVPRERRRAVLALARHGTGPRTSSAGRLFDAVSSLAGVCDLNRYEGQAAIELETRASGPDGEAAPYPLPLEPPRIANGGSDDAAATWNVEPLLRSVAEDGWAGVAPGVVAARFHEALACAIAEGCRWLREREGLELVVLSGGCFQNRRLRQRTLWHLRRDGFGVLTHARVPPNDGGISFGQAAVAVADSTP